MIIDDVVLCRMQEILPSLFKALKKITILMTLPVVKTSINLTFLGFS
jgi:hypothetical protein